MIKLRDRILLNDGTSIVPVEKVSEMILNGEEIPDYIRVAPGKDTEKYKEVYLKDLSQKVEDIEIKPEISIDGDDNELVEYLLNSKRDSKIDDTAHFKRIEQELKFFVKVDKLDLLHVLRKLIRQFKEQKIVWSSRGSSCSSYILYLLEVHDINPIKFKIDFVEFSKDFEIKD